MPIRGHSGVQGGAEMGAYATALPGRQADHAGIGARAVAALRLPGARTSPASPRPRWSRRRRAASSICSTASAATSCARCPTPTTSPTRWRSVPLRVHQDIILTDQMLLDPGEEVILLPAKTRYEQDDGGTETSTERRVMFSPEIPRQVGEAQGGVADPARARRRRRPAARRAARLRERRRPSATRSPASCRSTTASSSSQRTGDVLPVRRPAPLRRRTFPTARRQGPPARRAAAARSSARPARSRSAPGAASSSTRSSTPRSIRSPARARDAVFMNPDDAAALHLASGDRIALVNEHGRFEGRVHLAPIARGNLQVHWPEANVLIAARRRRPGRRRARLQRRRPRRTPLSPLGGRRAIAAGAGAVECGGLPPLWRGWGNGSKSFSPRSPPTPKRRQAAALHSADRSPTAGSRGARCRPPPPAARWRRRPAQSPGRHTLHPRFPRRCARRR